MAQSGSEVKKLKAATELAEFDSLFLEIVDELTKNELNNSEVADAFTWFKQMLQYNVPHGRKIRGLSVATSFQHLVPDVSENDIKIAHVLGWCIELDNVGMIAINDSFFLECAIYVLLRKYVRAKPYYMPVTEVFLEVSLQNVISQCLDLTTALPEAKIDFTQFTMERYTAIAKYKSGFAFYLSLAVALHMAGISDEESHAKAKTFSLKLGHFYQVEDDYLDCYNDSEVKVGTDTENNKCCWPIVKALEIASDEEKEELKLNYGRWDKEAVTKVKAIYKDLNLEEVYKLYEESSYQDITNLINSIDSSVPKEVFLDFANKIYEREK